MIQFNTETKSFTKLSETEFKSEHISERADFQEAIVDSWSIFRKEIGLPECSLIGKEIKPHSEVSWEDVLPKLKFSLAKKALELCRNEKEGDPRRRRFTHFRSNVMALLG